MADDADIAGPRQDQAVADAIARTPRPGGVSALICEDCEKPIPEARRIAYAGCTRCVPCQADYARSQKGR